MTSQPCYRRHRLLPPRSRESLIASVALLAAGCSSVPTIEHGAVYPDHAVDGRVLDVQVRRDGTMIHMTNTTAKPLGPGILWLNGLYSREFPELGVGASCELDLYEFKDQYGTTFRGGGFFASDKPDAVVLAELEPTTALPTEGSGQAARTLLGLVVVKGEE